MVKGRKKKKGGETHPKVGGAFYSRTHRRNIKGSSLKKATYGGREGKLGKKGGPAQGGWEGGKDFLWRDVLSVGQRKKLTLGPSQGACRAEVDWKDGGFRVERRLSRQHSP